MKIFGKKLLSFKSPPGKLYDFSQHGMLRKQDSYIAISEASLSPAGGKKRGRPKKVIQITPKGLYKMKALNANKFRMNVDLDYIDKQVAESERKLNLLPPKKKEKKNSDVIQFESGGVKYARDEVISIIERLENRKKISEFQNMMDEYPHTTNALINSVVDANSHLRCGKADEFVPDFPRVAVKAMEKYNKMCVKLCNKTTHFYVIASEDDFKKKDKRRDPILLAQSPFGFFWQILGAWDKEMIYLGDL